MPLWHDNIYYLMKSILPVFSFLGGCVSISVTSCHVFAEYEEFPPFNMGFKF